MKLFLAAALVCMLGGCSPVTKKIVAKEMGSTRTGIVTHYLVAEDGTSSVVGTREYYHTAEGDSFRAYNWSY